MDIVHHWWSVGPLLKKSFFWKDVHINLCMYVYIYILTIYLLTSYIWPNYFNSYLVSLVSSFVPHDYCPRSLICRCKLRLYLVNSKEESSLWAFFPGSNPKEKNFSASEKFFSTIHGLLQGFLSLSLIGLCASCAWVVTSLTLSQRCNALLEQLWILLLLQPSNHEALAIENKTFWGLKSVFSFLACWPASGDRK